MEQGGVFTPSDGGRLGLMDTGEFDGRGTGETGRPNEMRRARIPFPSFRIDLGDEATGTMRRDVD